MNSGAPEGITVPAPLVAPAILLSKAVNQLVCKIYYGSELLFIYVLLFLTTERTKVYSIQTVTFNMLSTTAIQIPTTNRETTPPNRETPPLTRETTPPNRETPPLTRETTPPNRETPPPNRETPSPNRETPVPTHPGK